MLIDCSNIVDSLAILNRHVEAITDQLADHAELLSRVVVHPQTSYPGRTHEHVLTQLLRKKLEPHIEDWAQDGRQQWQQLEAGLLGEKRQDMEELWTWAGDCVHEKVSNYIVQSDPYTFEERRNGIENVNTGLRMNWFDEEDDEDEEDGNDVAGEPMEGLQATRIGTSEDGHDGTMPPGDIQSGVRGPGKSLEELIRLATTGLEVG